MCVYASLSGCSDLHYWVSACTCSFIQWCFASLCVCVMRPDVHLPTESAGSDNYFIWKSLQCVSSPCYCVCHLRFVLLFFPVFLWLSLYLLFSQSIFLNDLIGAISWWSSSSPCRCTTEQKSKYLDFYHPGFLPELV